MSQHDSLRERYDQHKPKNKISKEEDKTVAIAASKVISYLKDRFRNTFSDLNTNGIYYDLVFENAIRLGDMIRFITRKGYRKWEDFDHSFDDKAICPDGGVIYLIKCKYDNRNMEVLEKYPLVIAEVKHQGTNDERLKEGKTVQAFGNAIERLGKNLSGVRAMMHYENITPFICFGDGCDFAKQGEIEDIIIECGIEMGKDADEIRRKFDSGTATVRAKIFTMNEFYDLNKVMVFKRNASVSDGPFSPVSMMFRYEPWGADDMYEYMKEIAETSFRYYLM